jgi:O-methyltransferase
MQDFSRLVHLCHYALETQPLDGMIVEFGCFNGDTAKLLSAITDKEVHVYDSFEGLPDVGEGFTPGTMRTMADTLLANFFRDGVRPPSIHLGWFDRLTPKDIPAQIAFAHLDGDLYASTMQAWHLIYDRLVSGAVVLVDDYDDPYFEGPRRACDEFLADKPERAVPLMGMCGLPSYKALVVKSV